MTNFELKLLPDLELWHWSQRIKPYFYSHEDNTAYECCNLDSLKNNALGWKIDVSKSINYPKLQLQRKTGTFTTYHTFGYYGFFKPSFAEVVSQLPNYALHQSNIFIIGGPKDADALNQQKEWIDLGFHKAKVETWNIQE